MGASRSRDGGSRYRTGYVGPPWTITRAPWPDPGRTALGGNVASMSEGGPSLGRWCRSCHEWIGLRERTCPRCHSRLGSPELMPLGTEALTKKTLQARQAAPPPLAPPPAPAPEAAPPAPPPPDAAPLPSRGGPAPSRPERPVTRDGVRLEQSAAVWGGDGEGGSLA